MSVHDTHRVITSLTNDTVKAVRALGSALAFQNAIGFAITTVAIALAMPLYAAIGPWVAWLLLPGPVLGLLGMRPLLTGTVAPAGR